MSLLPVHGLRRYMHVIYKLYDNTMNFGYCQVPDLYALQWDSGPGSTIIIFKNTPMSHFSVFPMGST